MVIVVDDADRENEGDLILAAEHATPAAINFMAKHGRGLICVPTTAERLKQFGVERMVVQNRETFKTDFQVSVDAASGITTGTVHNSRNTSASCLMEADCTASKSKSFVGRYVVPAHTSHQDTAYYSTNLTNWQVVANLNPSGSTNRVSFNHGVSHPRGYYRVTLP